MGKCCSKCCCCCRCSRCCRCCCCKKAPRRISSELSYGEQSAYPRSFESEKQTKSNQQASITIKIPQPSQPNSNSGGDVPQSDQYNSSERETRSSFFENRMLGILILGLAAHSTAIFLDQLDQLDRDNILQPITISDQQDPSPDQSGTDNIPSGQTTDQSAMKSSQLEPTTTEQRSDKIESELTTVHKLRTDKSQSDQSSDALETYCSQSEPTDLPVELTKNQRNVDDIQLEKTSNQINQLELIADQLGTNKSESESAQLETDENQSHLISDELETDSSLSEPTYDDFQTKSNKPGSTFDLSETDENQLASVTNKYKTEITEDLQNKRPDQQQTYDPLHKFSIGSYQKKDEISADNKNQLGPIVALADSEVNQLESPSNLPDSNNNQLGFTISSADSDINQRDSDFNQLDSTTTLSNSEDNQMNRTIALANSNLNLQESTIKQQDTEINQLELTADKLNSDKHHLKGITNQHNTENNQQPPTNVHDSDSYKQNSFNTFPSSEIDQLESSINQPSSGINQKELNDHLEYTQNEVNSNNEQKPSSSSLNSEHSQLDPAIVSTESDQLNSDKNPSELILKQLNSFKNQLQTSTLLDSDKPQTELNNRLNRDNSLEETRRNVDTYIEQQYKTSNKLELRSDDLD